MNTIHANISCKQARLKNDYRDRVELLRQRADLLMGRDRLLMTMYLHNGNSYYQIAQLAGVNEANISRRIRKIIKRLIDGEYIICLKHREKFTELQITIARDYFLHRLAIKKIAANHNLTYYRIRQVLKTIRYVVDSLRKNNNPPANYQQENDRKTENPSLSPLVS